MFAKPKRVLDELDVAVRGKSNDMGGTPKTFVQGICAWYNAKQWEYQGHQHDRNLLHKKFESGEIDKEEFERTMAQLPVLEKITTVPAVPEGKFDADGKPITAAKEKKIVDRDAIGDSTVIRDNINVRPTYLFSLL